MTCIFQIVSFQSKRQFSGDLVNDKEFFWQRGQERIFQSEGDQRVNKPEAESAYGAVMAELHRNKAGEEGKIAPV